MQTSILGCVSKLDTLYLAAKHTLSFALGAFTAGFFHVLRTGGFDLGYIGEIMIVISGVLESYVVNHVGSIDYVSTGCNYGL